MNYSAINIQGNIISSEILEKIRTEDIRFQKPSDFNLPPNTNVRDEINLAWSLAVSNWNVFKAKRDALKDSDSGTSETRKYWMLPLLGILGYETTTANAEIINDKSYAISHRATNKDGFPIHIIGINQSMDKRPETGGTRLSPHALAQEYINNVEHLYALVSNGSHLRLVRDATRLSRLSYLEFNLEQIMDEGLYVEFALLYRALHASRMPASQDQGADSILEFYHQEAIASGTRIRERLSTAVEQSIRELANGFLHHPQNEILRQQIESNKLDAKQYYFFTLRLVYRILFLLVIEERKLIYAEKLDEATTKKRSIYYDFYSLQRLTKLATKLVYVDPKKTDLWQSLLSTFALFEYGKYGSVLGIAPLGAGLFAPDALGVISHQVLDNECLLKVLRYLVTFENENKQQVRVNYADLDVEEFGSVYEGLLEYDPLFTDNIGQPVFSFVKGDARSSSGSHYTPEELVKPLIKHSLDYLIEDKLKEKVSGEWKMVNGEKVSGEWKIVSSCFPQIQHDIRNLLINLSIENEQLSGFRNLEKEYGLSFDGLPIKQIISKRRIVWDDFSNPKEYQLNTGKHSRRLGKKEQERIQQLPTYSQRELEGNGNTSIADSKNGVSNRDADSTDDAALRSIGQTNIDLTTIHFGPAQYALAWNSLDEDTRHSLFTNYNLLSLNVCDVACGSGHILLSAARRIGWELACLREAKATGQSEKVDQPTPPILRTAVRDVIKNCIYGVDLNPLAVELCKVALWLEAHAPGEPLNFLDHHIKCGNAIVGLAHADELENGIATEAFKTLPGDDKDFASALRKTNEAERKAKTQLGLYNLGEVDENLKGIQKAFADFKNLPEQTPEQIAQKEKAYQGLIHGAKWWRIKQLADLQVAQFFIPKTTDHKEQLTTDAQYVNYLKNGTQITDRGASLTISEQKHFFHWFLEFPEVFAKGGFDCILGNPPYLGGKKISGSFSSNFLEVLHYLFDGVGGQADLITYFIRRINSILSNNKFSAVITTNSISEGDTREGGLEYIIENGSEIIFAIKSTKWIGVANLNVALISIFKGRFDKGKILNGILSSNISSYLDEADSNMIPKHLFSNDDIMFRGVDFGGTGFILEKSEAITYLEIQGYEKVVLELINGDEINNEPNQAPQRFIINFHDLDEDKAKEYVLAYNVLKEKVKPYRESGNDKQAKEKWWIYKRNKIELYKEISKLNFCIVTAFTSKYLAFSTVRTNIVMSNALNILNTNKYYYLAMLNSNIHEEWVRKYSSSLESRLRYTPTDVFETFPFPQNITPTQEQELEQIGEQYHEHRKQLMLAMQLGLTKTYNAFHAKGVNSEWLIVNGEVVNGKWQMKSGAKPDKQMDLLYKHLIKTENTIDLPEAVQGIQQLRALHVQMDNAVLDAYGWNDIQLLHDFYEVDYLPENDRVRFTIHPNARKEILKRLLELNHKIYAEEVAAGLHDKKKSSGKKKVSNEEQGELF